MPRARSRRSSSAARRPSFTAGASSRTAAGSPADSSSRPTWIVSAMSCCCAPSCRFRSIFRRSASCASTSRRRDARSSSISAALRRTSPACDARCLQQFVLGAGQRLTPRLLQGQRAEQLTAMGNGYRARCPLEGGEPAVGAERDGRRWGCAVRPDRGRAQLRADPDPRLGAVGPGRPGQDRHHLGQRPR